MKRLCECSSRLSFPLTQPYSPSGTIHASEETRDDILEKMKCKSFPEHQSFPIVIETRDGALEG